MKLGSSNMNYVSFFNDRRLWLANDPGLNGSRRETVTHISSMHVHLHAGTQIKSTHWLGKMAHGGLIWPKFRTVLGNFIPRCSALSLVIARTRS
jgi:hypothetical protein